MQDAAEEPMAHAHEALRESCADRQAEEEQAAEDAPQSNSLAGPKGA